MQAPPGAVGQRCLLAQAANLPADVEHNGPMGKMAVKCAKYKPLRGQLCANCGESYEPVRCDLSRVRKMSIDPDVTDANLTQMIAVLEDKEKSFTPGPKQVKEGFPTFWRQFPDMRSPTKYVVLRTRDSSSALVPTHILFESDLSATSSGDSELEGWPKGLLFAKEDMSMNADGISYLDPKPKAYLRMEWEKARIVLSIEGKYAAMRQTKLPSKRNRGALETEDQSRLTGPPSNLIPKRPPSSVQTRSASNEKVFDVVAVACEEHSGSQ